MPTLHTRLTLMLIPMLAGVLTFAAGGAHGQENDMSQFVLPPRTDAPVIASTPEELSRLREAYASTGAAHEAVAAVVRRADLALETSLSFPERGGQHNQWYQCQDCQMGLETIDATHHRCPNCETVYSGAPYDDVVMAHEHSRNLRDMIDCAWAYAITGRADYAERAAAVLLGYAERYMQYERHDAHLRTGKQASRGGARLYEQTLNEAASMTQQIAPAYDLIHATLSDAEREAIESGLILPMLENMAGNRRDKSNWQTWHNAAMLWGGAVLGDEARVRQAIEGQGNGFMWQMENSVTADGAWYENSWGYHFYTLSAMTALAEGGRRVGVDLWSHPMLKKMYLLPTRYIMPDGTLPRFGDSLTSRLDTRAALMEAAWHAYRDPALLAVLPDAPLWETVLLGRTAQPTDASVDAAMPGESELFPAAGHAILRNSSAADGDAGNSNAMLAAAMTFGQFGGFHDHFDKLGFVFFGHGRELGVDPGRAQSQAYRLPIHQHWYRATLSHNAVLVNGRPQREASGTLELFAAGPRASAVRASVEVQPNVKQTRLLVLMPEYLLVLDEMNAPASAAGHTFDWLYHNHGSAADTDLALEPASLGKAYPGIEFVNSLRQGATDEMVRVRFPGEAVTTHLTLDAQAGTQVRVGDGPLGTVLERVPMTMIARRGSQVRFAATIEPVPSDAQPSVQAVRLTADEAGLTVDVTRGSSNDRITLAPDGSLRVQRDDEELLRGE